MSSDLGIIGSLLEATGQMNGHTFHVLPASDTVVGSPIPVSAVRLLMAALKKSRGPVLLQTDDGPLYGAHIPTENEARDLLVAKPCVTHPPSPEKQQAVLHFLAYAAQLVAERRNQQEESRQITEELSRAYEDLHLFSQIANQIRCVKFSGNMLRDLLQEVIQAMRVDLAAAMFDERAGTQIEIAANGALSAGQDARSFLDKLSREMPRSAPVFDKDCLIVNCSTELDAFRGIHPQPFRALAVRIQSGDQKYGWLLLASFKMQEIFRRGEYRLLRTMAEQLAAVITNSDLYRDLELFVINLVRSLVMAIEAKDVYTKGHSERVNAYCMRIADNMGIDGPLRADLEWASILHDVGKIGTPETILNKPDRLSVDEYERIKHHPSKGVAILQPITQLAGALPAIRHHHERYDGTGYPDGLQGESIPLLARIICVADTYDAITSDRAYRAAGPRAAGTTVLRQGSGSQFDPQIVDTFLQALDTDPVRKTSMRLTPDLTTPRTAERVEQGALS